MNPPQPPATPVEQQLYKIKRCVELGVPAGIVMYEAEGLRGPAMARVLGHLQLGQRALAARALTTVLFRLAHDGGEWSVDADGAA